MRSLPAKSPVHPRGVHASAFGKRRQKTALAVYCDVTHQGFLDGEEIGDWPDAETQLEHRFEPERDDDAIATAKHRFERELEVQLDDWDATLEELKASARDANAEVRAEFKVQLEALAGDRALAEEKLQELRQHGRWAWEDLKDDAEKTWRELREAIERSASCFN